MPGRRSRGATRSEAPVKDPHDKKSMEFLLGECARLRQDLIALTTERRLPAPVRDERVIRSIAESRFREFEGAAKEEVTRLSQAARIIREPFEKKKSRPPLTDKRRHPRLSTKIIKGVDIFPDASESRSLELEMARPKANVGYFHYVSREDKESTNNSKRAHLVVQSIQGIHIFSQRKNSPTSSSPRHSQGLEKGGKVSSQCSSPALEERSLESTEHPSRALEEGSLKSTQSSSQALEEGSLKSTQSSSQALEEGSLKSTQSSSQALEEGSLEYTDEEGSIGSSEEHNDLPTESLTSQASKSSQRNNLTHFLQNADKSLIDKLPLDEKMKIIRRNLRTYEEEETSPHNEGPYEDEQSTESLCEFLRCALSGKSYLSTIEERTETSSSLINSSHNINKTNEEATLSTARDLTLSQGQYVHKESHASKSESELGDDDDDDASSTDTFTVSAGEWNSLIY